jgi:amino acid transporter
LGAWNRRVAAPTAAIVVQAVIALGMIALVGTATGRTLCDATLQSVGLSALPWDEYYGGFETLVAGTTPVYWAFSLLTGIAVFALRAKDRAVERPFSMPLHPLPALAYCAACAYLLWASIQYARWLTLIGLLPLVIGGGLSLAIPRKPMVDSVPLGSA